MSWKPNRAIDMRVLHLKTVSDTVTAGGQVVKFTAEADLVGQPDSTYTTSTGQIVLPNVPCILKAGLEYKKTSGTNEAYYIDVQWYDVTNSQYIGSKARVKGYRPDFYYGSYSLTCDEEAIALAQNITVECRIIDKQGSPNNDQTLQLDNSASYSGASRALIMELHS